MIIRCEKCDTKYRLDASMISAAAVKVQCSKCAHIFIVPAATDKNKSTAPQTDSQTMPSSFPSPSPPPSREQNQGESAERDFITDSEAKTETKTKEDTPADIERNVEAEAEYGVKANTEAGAGIYGETKPSRDFEMTFTAPQDDPLNSFAANNENNDLTNDNAAEETKPCVEEETVFNELGSDIATEPSKMPDIAFSSPDDETEGGTANTETRSESNGSSFEPYECDKAEGSLDEPKEAKSNGDGPAGDFDFTFNILDKPPTGDGEVKKEFVAYEAATNDMPEPMAKYYVDKDRASTEPEEDLELRKRLEHNKDDRELSTEADAENPSFNEELLKAKKTEDPAPETKTKASPASAPKFAPPIKPTGVGAKKSGGLRVLAIIVLILILAGGILYIKTRPGNTLMALPSKAPSIEIESTKGYYVLNKDSGRIFVIESVIKNITEGPVKISGIRGLVLDSSGKEMASKKVAPGRIVTAKDLRTLPVDRLLRSFRDTSEGTIPKKAIIPTMVLFPDLNDAVAEYGIDVLR